MLGALSIGPHEEGRKCDQHTKEYWKDMGLSPGTYVGVVPPQKIGASLRAWGAHQGLFGHGLWGGAIRGLCGGFHNFMAG